MIELVVVATLFLGVLLALYAVGVPVAVAMGITSIIVMVSPLGGGFNLGTISNQLLFGLNSFSLLAIPFYLLLGRLMNYIGVTERIFRFANALVGQFRGGIAHVNVVASVIFSGMSGAAVADAAGLGRVEYTAMRDHGYDKKFSLGVTGASTIIGPLVPPSIPLIMYGVLAEESIGDLFLGGIFPGLLLALILVIMIVILSKVRGYEPDATFDKREFWESFKGAFLAIMVPILIVGGILSGLFTATEAGAVAVIYTLCLGMLYGEMTLGGLAQELQESMVETFALTFIIGVAALYGLVAVQLQLPIMMADAITAISDNELIVILLLVALLLVVGTFMETIAAITILVPVIVPILDQVGIDPLYFGIVMVLTLMIGLLTPPFGIVLFVLEKVTDASLEEVIRGILLFYVPMFLVLLIVILFPEFVLYIPNL
ncbi:TRAP transporter large permease [Halalkalicoccus tibetensis]|uniref:TRAP transporter large permease n=1 Tax=Halalkalicoccus tibetensis TaxID=175632 RepID=A0ABD5VE28_9EURY